MPILFILLFFSFGCANPDYVESGNNHQEGSESQADCSLKFEKSEICIDWKWEKFPSESEKGIFLFKSYRLNQADGSPVLVDLDIFPNVVLWMPTMGHGSSPVDVIQVDTGTYRALEVFFIMPGKWEIKFQMKENGQVIDEAIANITI